MTAFVPFDEVRANVAAVLRETELPPAAAQIHVIRDVWGRVRIALPESEGAAAAAFRPISEALSRRLGPRAYPTGEGVLFLDQASVETLEEAAVPLLPGVAWCERLVVGSGWWNASPTPGSGQACRYTLYSVKGGVGRSTTAAVLAQRLASKGERVLVVDLDLESPGLSASLIEPDRQPRFGVTDWFVEELTGQGSHVLDELGARPAWAQPLEGDVFVAPAHGRDPGEYLAKLGRVYVDPPRTWIAKLQKMLLGIETRFQPTTVLVESRSGLHDIAAATVCGLGAEILLFANGSRSCWTDYGILFRHWREVGVATELRRRLTLIAALTPEDRRKAHLADFREQAWNVFRDLIYDEVPSEGPTGDEFSFDIADEAAPHYPAVVLWTRGLAGSPSLRALPAPAVDKAYADVFERLPLPPGDPARADP